MSEDFQGFFVGAEPKLRFTYTNWRGETAERFVRPMRIWFGATEWHPEPQWFLRALDLDREPREMRNFAMKDMSDVRRA